MAPRTEITRADILPFEEYERVRPDRRRAMVALKHRRRVAVGPYLTVQFECWDTMWYQIHEMLRIERGGEGQIPGELEAYNPLVPGGDELVATVMIEIDDEIRRRRVLATLGGIETAIAIDVDGERIRGEAEDDVERTQADGKTSSVHFLHFRFTPAQVERFRHPGTRAVLVVDHPHYAHMAVIPDAVRQTLAEDFA